MRTVLRALAPGVLLLGLLVPLRAPAHDFGKTGQGGQPVANPLEPACNQCPCQPPPGSKPLKSSKGQGAGGCASLQNAAGLGSQANGGNGNGTAGDPIESFTGRFRYEHVDLEINGVLPIRMVRRYDSQSRYDSSLGYGWSFDYDVRLYEYEDGSVIVRGPWGQRDRYLFTGGAFVHQDGVRGRAPVLTAMGSGYELRYQSGDVAAFDAEGLLTRLRDPQGNYLEFRYEGTPPARQDLLGISPFSPTPTQVGLVARVYQLTRIEEFLRDDSTTGRFVTLEYDGNGRLDFVDSFDGRHVDYAFSESYATPSFRGNLAKVTDAELIEYVYRYEDPADLHNLTFVQEGQGTTETRNVYDAQDRVETQATGAVATAQRKWTFGYGTLTASGRTTTIVRTIFDESGVAKPSATTVLEFNASGHVTRKTDALGNRITYARTNAAGSQALEPPEKITITVERKTGPSSFATERVVTLTLDADQNIANRVVTTNGETVTETWTYDHDWVKSYHRQTTRYPGEFFLTTYAFVKGGLIFGQGGYDDSLPPENVHSITRRIDAVSNEVTTFGYHPASGQIARIELPDVGSESVDVVRSYHTAAPQRGLLASIGLEVNAVADPHLARTFSYDARVHVDAVIDANENEADFDFDALGRLVAVTREFRDESVMPIVTKETTTVFSYTGPNDDLSDAQLENPAAWRKGNLLTRIEVGRTLAEGHVQRRIHDPKGRLVRVERKDPVGPTYPDFAVFAYDSDDLRVRATDGEGKLTRFAYDAMTQLVSVTDPATPPNTTSFAYDVLGNRTLIHDAKNRDTVFVYDALSRLTEVQVQGPDPDEITKFLYDAAGNVRSVKDPKDDQETLYTYDGLSRLRTVTQPNGTDTVVYDYDARSRLRKVTNARTDELLHTYFPWGALQEVLYDLNKDGDVDSGERQISYTYDENGNLLTTSDDEIQAGPLYTFSYDPQNRVDDVTVHYLPGSTDPVLDSRYDGFGNRTGLVAVDAVGNLPHVWRFDAFDRLFEAVLPPGNADPTLRLAYNGRDDVTGITRWNTTPDDYLQTDVSYFDQGPVDTLTVSDLLPSSAQRLLLDYGPPDATLNVTGQSESRDSGSSQTTSYLYDGADRLSDANYPAAFGLPADQAFVYDPAGNRDDRDAPGSFTYNVNNQITLSPDYASYSFDADGNLTGRTGETFTWDATNRLRSFTKSGTAAAYAYDPFGRRIQKTVNSVQTFYLWDGDQLIAEYDASGVRQVRYAYAGGFAPIQVARNNGTGEDVFDVHSDHLDTPRMLTDSTGAAAWRASYEAYGEAHLDPANSVTFNVRFPGQYFDAESELHSNRFRTYDSAVGRYISADPIGQSGGLNVFGYGLMNPLRFIDPLGLEITRADVDAVLAWMKKCHSELLAALPGIDLTGWLQTWWWNITPQIYGNYDPRRNRITLNSSMDPGRIGNTMTHEHLHSIQSPEELAAMTAEDEAAGGQSGDRGPIHEEIQMRGLELGLEYQDYKDRIQDGDPCNDGC